MNTELSAEQLQNFKKKLEEEKTKLETDLKEVGHKNNAVPGDWEAVSTDNDESIKADKNEVADKIEEYEANTALVNQFETRLTEVNEALARMKDGTYGICRVSGKHIEIERLEANPAATTSKEFINAKH
jgi:DnaK suppressor protein